MTQAESIYNYLWSIAPDGATNSELARQLGITSHQTVYMATRNLLHRRRIRGERRKGEWVFYAVELPAARSTTALPAHPANSASKTLTPYAFEELARRILGDRYAVTLSPGSVNGVHKEFDLVSPDGAIVGDAKYYDQAGPAKFSTIAEDVWLLEKTNAPVTLLVFGNNREVPRLWLKRYGNLVFTVVFYFLTDDGRLELLHGLEQASDFD